MEYNMQPISEPTNDCSTQTFLSEKRHIPSDSSADEPMLSNGVHFDVVDEEVKEIKTRLDAHEQVSPQLDPSDALHLASANEVPHDMDLAHQVNDSHHQDMPIDAEVTVYYDTVTMNPDWDDLDNIEEGSDANEPAANTLTEDFLAHRVEDHVTYPTDIGAHTANDANPSEETTLTLIIADSASMDDGRTHPYTANQAGADSVVEDQDSQDISADCLATAVDYDADTSSWHPAKAKYDADSDSDGASVSSDGERTCNKAPGDTDSEPACLMEPHDEAWAVAAANVEDITVITALDKSSKKPADADAALASLLPARYAEEPDTAQLEVLLLPIDEDSDTTAALLSSADVDALEAPADDDALSLSLATSGEVADAFEKHVEDPTSEKSEFRGALSLSRAVNIHSEPALDLARTGVVTDNALVGGLTEDNTAELGLSSLELGVRVILPEEALPVSVGLPLTSNVVVEAVEPMSLSAMFGLWIHSIVYVKVIGFLLSGIYHSLDCISSVVPIGAFFGFLSVGVITSIVLGVISAVAPFTGLTGVIFLIGVLLVCFHGCAAGDNSEKQDISEYPQWVAPAIHANILQECD